MITLTNKAAEKVRQILSSEKKEGHALRVAVKGGGCSGFTYTLDLSDSFTETDQIFEDKAYIDMPNIGSLTFLNPRTYRIGVRISF